MSSGHSQKTLPLLPPCPCACTGASLRAGRESKKAGEKHLKCLDTSSLKVEMISLKNPRRALLCCEGSSCQHSGGLGGTSRAVESCQLSHNFSVSLVM